MRKRDTEFDISKLTFYLCGPMDYAPDGGLGWRRNVKEKLIKMGVSQDKIYNPCDKPVTNNSLNNLNNEKELIDKCRKDGKWDELCSIVKKIAHIDLRCVDKSDVIIVNIPKNPLDNTRVPVFGSIHEIVEARRQKKLVLVVWEGGKIECSGWIMWLVGHENIFNSINHLLDNLKDAIEMNKENCCIFK